LLKVGLAVEQQEAVVEDHSSGHRPHRAVLLAANHGSVVKKNVQLVHLADLDDPLTAV
jgi:hypothetical protein